jgi:hypothetical protein
VVDPSLYAFAVLGAFGFETLRYQDAILKATTAYPPTSRWDRAFGLFLGLLVALVVTGPIITLGDWTFGHRLPVLAPSAGSANAIIAGFFLQLFLSQTARNLRD